MKKKNSIIFVFIIIFLNLTEKCQSLNKNFSLEEDTIYEQSRKALKEKKFNNAISILETIKKSNINNLHNDKIQINLIYAYYKNLNLNMAQKTAKEFIRLHPNHEHIDYIMYMQCLINMAMDKNIYFKILPIDYYKNNTYYALKAFFQLKNLIYQYPNSPYVINAKKNLIYLKNRLSEHDLQILKFYFFQKEYIATVNRGEEILQKYSETPAARKALIYMEQSYIALKIFDTAQKISKIITLNKI